MALRLLTSALPRPELTDANAIDIMQPACHTLPDESANLSV
jgi:hypothetical protein